MIMDISLFKVSILIVVGSVVFWSVRNLFKNGKAVPPGAKPLPGPKGN